MLEEVVTDCRSIGDYVLTGGGAGSHGDCRCSGTPRSGVLGNEQSARDPESFHGKSFFGTSAIFQTGCVAREKGAEVCFPETQKHIDHGKRNSPSCVQKRNAGRIVLCPLCAGSGMRTTAYETETVAHRYD